MKPTPYTTFREPLDLSTVIVERPVGRKVSVSVAAGFSELSSSPPTLVALSDHRCSPGTSAGTLRDSD